MSSNYDLSALAVAALAPGNELLYDDKGIPSVMVKIPKMTYADLGMGESTAVHPAFIVNGQEVDFIWISKYMNIVQNSRAYSLPGQDYAHSMTFDQVREYCENKGEGWHLMTRMEWGLIVRWCQNNGVMPKGNNYYGKHSSEKNYKAIPMTKDSTGRTLHTAGGTGPLTWYHDQAHTGIADLCGNGWEWSGGIRTVYGELQILANNNGADSSNPQSAASTVWMAINASDGSLITPDGSGTTTDSVKMDWVSSKLTYSTSISDSAPGEHNCSFANIVCDDTIGDNAQLLLSSLGLLQYNGQTELFSGHYVYFNNSESERCFVSGGACNSSASGLASFGCFSARSGQNSYRGFRAAYVKLPSA